MTSAPLDVVVTVGMGPYPFDRLVAALTPLCARHRVFAQIGTSTVVPPCEHRGFVEPRELHERMRQADVVVTHAGNTVRVVQRMGKVPIAVARRAAFGEMSNDHQVAFLRVESRQGRVVVADQLDHLAIQVGEHPGVEAAFLALRPLPPPVDGTQLADRLDDLLGRILGRPAGRREAARAGR